VRVSPDGSRVFVTGESDGITGLFDYATVAYDAATGDRLWVRRYNGPGNGNDNALSLTANPDGSELFVTGISSGITSGGDYATVSYDAATGARMWVRRYNGPGNGNDEADSVALNPDGSKVFVTGFSLGRKSGLDYATVSYGA
jgi:WD40 repeat protein